MRKTNILLSFVMAFSLLGTSISGTYANSVSTEYDFIKLDRPQPGGELISDGGFENGHTQWKKTGDGSFTDYPGCAAVGTWCGLLPSQTSNACVYQVVNVKPNTEYVAKAKILLAKEGSMAFFNIKNSDVSTLVNGAEKTVTCTKEQEWTYQDVELTFNTGNYSQISVCTMKWTEGNSGPIYDAQVYVDEVSLKEKNAGSNPAEETYEMIWADDFNGTTLDQNKWGYELGCIRGIEQQHYVDDQENVYVKDGKLTLKATDRPTDQQYINPRSTDRKVIYNSGSVRTHGKQEFLYGRIEAKAKLPKGQAVFPAFWTLGADFCLDGDVASSQGTGWARCGEIDIMELIGAPQANGWGNKTVYQTIHTMDDGSEVDHKLAGTSYTIDETFNDDYHVFGINWSPNKIEWYVDNKIVQSVDYSHDEIAKKCLNRPQYIQFNLAMGGAWPGVVGTNLAGTTFDIDYVYYGQTAEQKAAAEAYYNDAPVMEGVQNIVMSEGDSVDLLKDVTVTDGYELDFSVEDGPMFATKEGTNTNVDLVCTGKDNASQLVTLPVGQYNVHYSARNHADKNKFARQSATLTIKERTFPSDFELNGEIGKEVSTIDLPKGWTWDEPTTILKSETQDLQVTYTNGEYSKTVTVSVTAKKVDTEIKPDSKPTHKPNDSVQTGDEYTTTGFIVALVFSALVFLGFNKKKYLSK